MLLRRPFFISWTNLLRLCNPNENTKFSYRLVIREVRHTMYTSKQTNNHHSDTNLYSQYIIQMFLSSGLRPLVSRISRLLLNRLSCRTFKIQPRNMLHIIRCQMWWRPDCTGRSTEKNWKRARGKPRLRPPALLFT